MKTLALLIALSAGAALAQVVPEREVEISQALYDAGKYAEVARRSGEVLALANFTDAQRIKLLELAGLALFNLGDQKAAQTQFLQLLRINPDYVLDPFAVPPLAIRLFDQVRRENADALNLARQQILLRAEQSRREAEERARLEREQEERKRRAESLVSQITVRTIERRSMAVNFIPFGAGQFQQGRLGWGAAFAVSEGVLSVLSIVSFFAIESLYVNTPVVLTNVLTGDNSGQQTIMVRNIPADRQTAKNVWTGIKYGTGIAFYALWALGVGEAIWHHEDEIITERKEAVPAGSTPAPPTARFRIFPTNGGLGAGVTIGF